ncbi:hypothetical protein Pint_35316 [Pistacia integerrima]|uniref:Uncharacterized protein n=1 Tax=Pistacia integerrima TaxID=434235 RepID=A0ACC0Y2C1_9ROSI|nr:hypothetical protein Pint_35316 [Pistacia integerrima]
MDYDGNLRLYSLNNLTGSWMISWQAIMEQCKVHGICGRNEICVSTPSPSAHALAAMRRLHQWNLARNYAWMIASVKHLAIG